MKVRKAIIPAAGLGTTFLPATKAQPKEMLPIVDKPTIQYITEEAVASGIEEILIITGRNKKSIEDHFDKSVELELELEKSGSCNRILNVSPGSIKGTSFNNGKTDLTALEILASDIIKNLKAKNDLFIPNYDEIYKDVLARYQSDFREEGRHSYDYKINSNRIVVL